MKIVNLIENTEGCSGCASEHGLSFYIETEKHKLLVDTGATDAFIQNAEILGVNLASVDTVILSHGHYDHGGGLPAFVNGILNILDTYKELRKREPDVVISGFHMMRRHGYSEEDLVVIRRTAAELKNCRTRFYTGHCTDQIPFETMKEIMGDQLIYVHSGDIIEL